jgi:hypothetical protein
MAEDSATVAKGAAPVDKGTAPHPLTEGDPPEVVIGEVDPTPTILSEQGTGHHPGPGRRPA